jgi:signal transduction histidine kinase/DNA-binding response OmpR family regulator
VFIMEEAFANSMGRLKGPGSQPDVWISPLDSGTVQRPVLLIVDDETLGLKTLASVFEDQDYELVMAGTGVEALRFLETCRADLVLLDVMMPGLDGYEICRRIRLSRPGIADVPILLVTALDDRRSRLVGLEAGADDFISKPIDRAEIRARVKTITRLNRSGRLQEEMVHTQQAMSELREYSRRLDVLREIDRSILMAASVREIAAGVLPLLHMLIPFKHAAIYKRDHRGESIRLLAEEGNRPFLAAVGDPLTLADLGVEFEFASAGNAPLMLELSKQGAMARVSQQLLASAGVGVMMAAPLTLKDRLLGVLLLGAEHPSDLTGIHAQIAQEVGAIVSLALAHAELLDNVTRSHGQLESLSHRLLQVREEELRRIARELHDEIGQSLAILNLNLARARKAAETPRSRQSLEDCGELVAGLMTKVRGLSLDLHPALLDDFGIVTALRRHIETLAGRIDLHLLLDADESIGRLDPEMETVCFRVVQEALTNVIRHARASTAKIRLALRAGRLKVSVVDDGGGFDAEAAMERGVGGASLGLLGMRERVSLVGGELQIISTPGKGSEIKVSFPVTRSGK